MRERGDEGRKREGPKEEGIIGPKASLPAAESDYQLWFRMINRGRLTWLTRCYNTLPFTY
jgi:hypothetical protein